MKGGEELLMVAGEASGDLHGARLLAELRGLAPEVQAFGLGGDQLTAAGFERIADAREIAVVGISEALRVLPRARVIFRRLLEEVERRRTRTAVLIDFPDFNLRLARELKKRGVRVLYYISPQVWAWRRRRVKMIARVVDRMLVLFPFEVAFYRERGVEVVHVGHPLVDEVPSLESVWDRSTAGGPFELALLPGSRVNEVEALLPVMLEAVRRLAKDLPLRVRLLLAPTVPRELVDEEIALSGLPVEVAVGDRFQRLAESHLAICASGTATLETGLVGTPLIVIYRLASWTYFVARLLVRLPYFSLVNLVLGKRAVPELVQFEARPARIADEARRLLTDREAVAEMRRELVQLRPRLGEGGASRRAAIEVARFLGAEVPA